MTRWFHGGPAGLSGQGFILPPDETKVYSGTDAAKAMKVLTPHRTDRIYLTTNFAVAEFFALYAPAKAVAVYEVEPLGCLEADPDCKVPNESFQVERARILKETRVRHSRRVRLLERLGVSL